MTNIKVEWTDKGAKILSSIPITCPVCIVEVTPNMEHLCGNMLPKESKVARKAKKVKS